MDKVLIKECLFLGSWLAFPFIAWLLWRMRRPGGRIAGSLVLALSLVFVWARFIEPQLIRVTETELTGTGARMDVALVSDIHLGVYKDSDFLQRLVERINAERADAVVIAGDLTYEPQGQSMHALFAPLAGLQAPVYAVLGNHDQQAPGPDIDRELRAALQAHGVQVIEGRIVEGDAPLRWAGLGDRWARKDDAGFLKASPSAQPTVVVAHNPDSAWELPAGSTTLLLAGHTHGGQIRLPWLYHKVIPSQHGFDRGEQFADTPSGRIRVFTTAGVGEVGLPMRLFNPPTIDLLHLRP